MVHTWIMRFLITTKMMYVWMVYYIPYINTWIKLSLSPRIHACYFSLCFLSAASLQFHNECMNSLHILGNEMEWCLSRLVAASPTLGNIFNSKQHCHCHCMPQKNNGYESSESYNVPAGVSVWVIHFIVSSAQHPLLHMVLLYKKATQMLPINHFHYYE